MKKYFEVKIPHNGMYRRIGLKLADSQKVGWFLRWGVNNQKGQKQTGLLFLFILFLSGFALKGQHRNIVFLRRFADMRK